MPARWVAKIVIDPLNSSRIYVAFMGWEADNVWFSGNGGGTWSSKSGAGVFKIPSVPVSAFNVHPTHAGWLYAGTDLGLFFSADDGASWTTSNSGPSIVPVEELHWVNGTLVAVTHGRGVYQTNVSSTSIPFSPEIMELVSGNLVSGRLQELYGSDDRYVKVGVRPGFSGLLHLTGTSPIQSPTKLAITLEASTTSYLVSEPLWVSIWNPSGVWDDFEIRRLFLQDNVYQFELTGSQAAAHVDPITRRVKVQLRWRPGGLASSTFAGDQVVFEVEP
jgi:hypothetical protein